MDQPRWGSATAPANPRRLRPHRNCLRDRSRASARSATSTSPKICRPLHPSHFASAKSPPGTGGQTRRIGMAAANYDESLKRLLVHEGGYSNHPSDPGGPTNFGITLHDYRTYIDPDGTAAGLPGVEGGGG